MKLLFLLLSLPLWLAAEISWRADAKQPFALSIKLNAEKIALDEVLHVEAEFSYPANYELDNENLLDHLKWSANPLAPHLSLQQADFTLIQERDGVQGKKLQAVVRPLAAGPLYLTFLTVELTPKEKENPPVEIATPVFTIQVIDAAPQKELSYAPLIPMTPEFPMGLTEANRQFLMEDPKRIEADKMHMQSVLERRSFPWLTLVMLLGLGALGWFAYLTREHWPKRKAKPVISLSPKEQAGKSLKELYERDYLENGLFEKYYTELSSILLTALQGFLGWKTKEMTTAELGASLKKDLSLTKESKQKIFGILNELDQVKFAGKQSTLAEAKEMHARIQALVDGVDKDTSPGSQISQNNGSGLTFIPKE